MACFDPQVLKLKSLEELEVMLEEHKENILEAREIRGAILNLRYRDSNWRNTPTGELAARPLKDDKEIKRVEILILGWELPEVEVDCLSHIVKNTTHPYKITFFDNRPNSYNGCNTSKAWNKLVRESTCPYILIMDSDAFVKTDRWLEKLVVALDRHPNAAVIGASSEGGVTTAQKEYIESELEQVLTKGSHISGYCFMFKREMFDKIGEFDEQFYVYGQDSDWMNRIAEKGYEVLVHRGVLIQHGYDKATYSMSNRAAANQGVFDISGDSRYSGDLVLFKRNQRYEQRKKEEEALVKGRREKLL